MMKHLYSKALLFFSVIIPSVAARTDAATLFYNSAIKYQTIVGFGGGFSFHTYPFNHPKKDELYDSLFNNAQVNIVRVGNWYDPQENNAVKEIPMIREINAKWPEVKTMIASWTPPAYLKSNDTTSGVTVTTIDTQVVYSPATLRKNSDSTYMYAEYAQYWYKTLKHFSDSGVTFDWVSVQNEPDVKTDYEGCQFDSMETPSTASYGKALDAVYEACRNKFARPVQFIGPDIASIIDGRMQGYNSSPEIDNSKLSAYSHHYYDYASRDWLFLMNSVLEGKPVFMTEFLVSEGKNWVGAELSWFDHAQYILNLLKYERVAMYCVFALAYKPASTHCFFSLDTLGGDTYVTRPSWYMFKHFSRSIHRGWRQLASETSDTTISAVVFASPSLDSISAVVINLSPEENSVNYEIPELIEGTCTMYQTTDSLKYVMTSDMPAYGQVQLPARSITTLEISRQVVGTSSPVPVAAVRKTGISTIAPNAGRGFIVSFSAPGSSAEISVADLRGRVIARKDLDQSEMKNGIAVLGSAAAAGCYTVTLSSGTSRFTRSFVVSR